MDQGLATFSAAKKSVDLHLSFAVLANPFGNKKLKNNKEWSIP